jgi:hypothetical protein
MAASWIKVEVITPDKPEVFQLSEIMNLDPDAVLGKLVRLWAWADQQTIDGNANCNAASVTKKAIDRITFVSGFADALITVGWLVLDEGGLIFPNFERHNGNTSKNRAVTNRRVTKSRDLKRTNNAKCNGVSVTHTYQKPLPEEEEEEDIKDKTLLSHGEKNATRPDDDSQQSEQDGSTPDGGKNRHEYTPDFEAAWSGYPRRPGSPDKHGAFKAWNARLRDGVTAESMLDGVRRYAAFVVATGKSGTEFIKQAKTFFGPSRHFEDEWLTTSGGTHAEFRFNQNDPRPYSEQYLEWEQRQQPAGASGMAPVGPDVQNLRPALECEEWQSTFESLGGSGQFDDE